MQVTNANDRTKGGTGTARVKFLFPIPYNNPSTIYGVSNFTNNNHGLSMCSTTANLMMSLTCIFLMLDRRKKNLVNGDFVAVR